MTQTPRNPESDIEARLSRIESELAAIAARNERVTADIAWEVSIARRFTVAAITYFFASLLLWALGNSTFLLNAFVPTAGYIVSTLTLPWAKRRWGRSQA
jgi:hypothetical protein